MLAAAMSMVYPPSLNPPPPANTPFKHSLAPPLCSWMGSPAPGLSLHVLLVGPL